MSEIVKRILTSIVLFLLFLLSIFNQILLIILLFASIIQILYELNIILKKLFFKKSDQLKLYIIFVFVTLYTVSLGIIIFCSLNSNNELSKIYLFMIILVCISSDIGGYIFGNIFKGKKLTKISPKKTYSGAIGSYLSSITLSVFIFKEIMPNHNILLISFILSTISQLGDISISFIKRKVKLKDTGSLLPGHGGLLDRFDGMFYAIPIGTLLIYIL